MNCSPDRKMSSLPAQGATGMGNAHGLMIVPSRSGLPSLKMVAPDGSERLLHSSYDPVREARELVDRFNFDGHGILVVLGLGLGYHVAELAARFPEAEIIVIEALPESAELVRQQETLDFCWDFLSIMAGLTPAAALQKVTERQLLASLPPLAMFALPAAVAAFPGYYQPLREKLGASVNLNLAARLRYRKFREESTRVLLFDCGYFLTREVAAALKQLGHRVERLHFDEKTPVGQLLASLISSIARFRPDFCLTINHLGFDDEGAVTELLHSIELPVASWFVDSPELIVKGFDNNVSPFTALFVWDTASIAGMRQAGFEAVSYLPLATDPELFRPLPGGRAEVARLAASVGFIGNSMVERLKDKLAKVPTPLHPLADKLARRLGRQRTAQEDLFATLDITERRQLDRLGARERLAFETAVTWQATLLYRRACIEQLRGFGPVIHGDQGWRKLLDAGFILRPPLDYYCELSFFYNACSVNFNATNMQMATAVNQRLFDVPACGGFLITDHQQSLEELFTVGEEVITYRDLAEIPDLLRFYLDNPAARNKVAKRGRERILRQHTYRHRLETLFTAMKNRYA